MSVEDGTILTIDNAPVVYADFTGRENRWTGTHVRYFGVMLVEDSADRVDELRKAGWKVKHNPNRPEWGMFLNVSLPARPDFEYLTPTPEEMAFIPETAHATKVGLVHGKTLVIYGHRWEYHGSEGLIAILSDIKE